MRKGVALGVPGVALATAGGLWAQARRVANAPLPRFADLDPSGDYGSPHGAGLRIAVLGDSSVTGPGLPAGHHTWIARLADQLPWRVEMVSHARGGSRARDVLADQTAPALLGGADLFVVAVGANDAMHGTPAWQFGRQLTQLFSLLGDRAPVVSLGIGDLSVIPRLPRTLRPIVAQRSATMDRTHAAVTSRFDRVVRVPVAELSDPVFRSRRDELFAADLFHPNEVGHELWAELFAPFVRSVADQIAGAPAVPGPERLSPDRHRV